MPGEIDRIKTMILMDTTSLLNLSTEFCHLLSSFWTLVFYNVFVEIVVQNYDFQEQINSVKSALCQISEKTGHVNCLLQCSSGSFSKKIPLI